jgi:folate-binding protein YgfZ
MAEATTLELDAQYRQLREECGVLDRADRGRLSLTGGDVGEFLQGQLTNDIESLAPGEGCYAALLDRKGHMQADMRVLRLAEGEYWIDTEGDALDVAQKHLEMYRIGRDVDVEDVSPGRCLLSLIGPGSAHVADIPGLPEHASEELFVLGVDSIAVGTATALDLIVLCDDAARLRAALVEAGAAEVSTEAAEILRVEAGVPRFGAEMDTGTMPAEAGIVEAAVSFDKGCYIGQETVARLHYKGKPNRHLRGLRLSAPVPPGAPVNLGEKEVGRIGSSCVSPAFGPIALAVLRREAEPGDELRVGEDGVTARVVDLPFG